MTSVDLSTDATFELDPFQRQACEVIDARRSVLVAAPTGSGKTVVAEHALRQAVNDGKRAFYTSPIKALANQKYRDFCGRFGDDNVGLLTGDTSIRGDSAIVVMTTEVLRNMLYEQSAGLNSVGWVVLDEVHYLQDRHRGPVWEEVLLHLPQHVRTVSLSATVSNLEEFAGWLRSVRGATELVVAYERAVPLEHRIAATHRDRREVEVMDLTKGKGLSPAARRLTAQPKARRSSSGQRSGGRSGERGGRPKSDRPEGAWSAPKRIDLVDDLIDDDLGPIIWFIFSRKGCDDALDQFAKARAVYTTDDEADALLDLINEHLGFLDDDDWYALELDRWSAAFECGIAVHHAGLIPAVKEATEHAFELGLIKVVFATETLALGVNLPARTVVLDRLVKFNGDTHELLTPLEYTQLSGRAGRRGLDDQGTSVLCWGPRMDVQEVAELVLSRDFPLRSAFTPNYNMVANLVHRFDADSARDAMRRSFAQYQRTELIDRLAADVAALDKQRDTIEAALICDRGDVRAWKHDGTAWAADEELGQLRPGDVIRLPKAKVGVVVSVAHRSGGVVVRSVDAGARIGEWRTGTLPSPLAIGESIRAAVAGDPNDRELVKRLGREVASLGTDGLIETGVGGCPRLDEHLAALRESERLDRALAKRQRRSRRKDQALTDEFDAVVEVLTHLGFVEDWRLTSKGMLLMGVFGEGEAVLATAIAEGMLVGLEPPELAAALSSLSYEKRGTGAGPAFRWPTRNTRAAIMNLQRAADALTLQETKHLSEVLTRRPDPGLADIVYRWAMGDPLADVLDEELRGGDFVRNVRQVADLCRQVAQVADGALSEVAEQAAQCIDRDVIRSSRHVAASWTDEDGLDHEHDKPGDD